MSGWVVRQVEFGNYITVGNDGMAKSLIPSSHVVEHAGLNKTPHLRYAAPINKKGSEL